MTDDPLEALGGRTPLEVAKTPFMDELARRGKVGLASFAPSSLSPSREAALFSVWGYSPAEFYTGTGPLDALAFGLEQREHELVFRCDLVAVLDEALVDATAGFISPRESGILIDALNANFSSPKIRFHAGEGYKNLLLIKDETLAESWEGLEMPPPLDVLGERWTRHAPKGKKNREFADLLVRMKTFLESHEINRVRVDLKENPANMAWLWGQGKRPKLPLFKQKFGHGGVLSAEATFAKGLGKALGFRTGGGAGTAADLPEEDVCFICSGNTEKGRVETDFRRKIKKIEEFDARAARLVRDHAGDRRVLLTTDVAESSAKGALLHGHVPFLLEGDRIESDAAGAFNERAASQSKTIFNAGHELMGYFLSGGAAR